LPFKKTYIKFESVAFWFWFFLGVEPCLTFLFFRSKPALGTLVGYLPPPGFAFFLLSSVLIGKRLQHPQILRSMATKLLLAFVFWLGMTLFWTGSSSRFSACGYWAILAIKVFVVLLLLVLGNLERVGLKSLQGYAWGGFVFALVPLLSNVKGSDGRLGDEEFLHPNTIGHQMAIISLCAIYLALQSWGRMAERRSYILISGVLVFTLLRSLSKTSILSFLLAALLYLVRSKISVQKKISLVLLASGLIAISYSALSTYLDEYLKGTQGEEALTTATGRTVIWEMTWEMIQANPILGYGYQSYRDVAPQVVSIRLVHAHNEWFNTWFSYGAVGLILAVLVYASYYWQMRRAGKGRFPMPQEALGLALLIYALVRGCTEASVTDLVYPLPLMMLMIGWLTPISSSNGGNHG
jgi:O-antigen ligase